DPAAGELQVPGDPRRDRPAAAPDPLRAAARAVHPLPPAGPDRRVPRRAEMTRAILELDDLSKSFGGLRAVADLSFAVQEKTITSLIGGNGAGKTTVFNLVTGYLPPDSGRILF